MRRRFADTVAVILGARGFDVRVAYGSIVAAELALRIAPDVVIGDFVKPDKNGIELALEIAEKLPHCKGLLFSGRCPPPTSSSRSISRYADLGQAVHPDDLLTKIRSAAT